MEVSIGLDDNGIRGRMNRNVAKQIGRHNEKQRERARVHASWKRGRIGPEGRKQKAVIRCVTKRKTP